MSASLAKAFGLFSGLLQYRYYHAIHIALEHSDDPDAMVALFHDLVEDGDVTWQQIEDAKVLSDEQLEALKTLTHDKSMTYRDYILSCVGNPIARKVKLWDVEHHLNTKDSLANWLEPKYHKARSILTGTEIEHQGYGKEV